MKTNIKSDKFWNRVSNKSDKTNIQLKGTSVKIIDATLSYLNQKDDVLDFACGSGAITLGLAPGVKSIKVIDTSSGMIETARLKAGYINISNVKFMQSNIFDDDHKEESFDTILAFNVLHYISDIPQLMEKISGLLKPGGLFISSTVCLGEKKSVLSFLISAAIKIGIVPDMKFFKRSSLHEMVVNKHFEILETRKLSKLPENFMVVKKLSRK